MTERSVAVVGGGIVGLAVACELTVRRGLAVTVFEKESQVATHQTARSSNVAHAGLYYRPGSLKADLCARGRAMLAEFCAEHQIAFDERGKLVVAVDGSELARFDALEVTARRNRVPGLRRLSCGELTEREPRVRGLAALLSPRTALVDFVAVAQALARTVEAAGGRIRTDQRVDALRRTVGGAEVVTADRAHRFDHVVVCAGLHADRLTPGPDVGPRIVPFRGEYLAVTDPQKQRWLHAMVYPVPDPRYPFLGVHFTPRLDGGLEIGPNALLALRRESYGGRLDARAADLRDLASWPGTWRLAARHWRTGAGELWRSLAPRSTMRLAQRYVPEITVDDVRWSRVGVRAQAVSRDGSLLDDFVVEQDDAVTAVRNAPSPAATSCLAIAEHVVDGMWR